MKTTDELEQLIDRNRANDTGCGEHAHLPLAVFNEYLQEIIDLRKREDMLYKFAALYALGYFSSLPPHELKVVRELGERACDALTGVGSFCDKLGNTIASVARQHGTP